LTGYQNREYKLTRSNTFSMLRLHYAGKILIPPVPECGD